MSHRLVAQNISRTLVEAEREVPLVRGVSLKVDAGEFVAILGPSGCGKSSLLYLLGLLDRPTLGEVLIDGAPTSGLSQDERTRIRLEKVGFVFQFHFLLPEFTALENVALPMRRLGRLNLSAAHERARALLVALGLEGEDGKRPSQMSGGQRQRVAIARSLANDPSLILCDEPTGNLDSANSEIVVDVFKRLAHQEKRAIICVTHDEAVAAAADRRIRMKDGEIIGDERGA
jgi:lipoprotein-releasing system ATP-binding protein